MKFQFNIHTRTLKIPAGEYFRVFSEEAAFFTQFGGIGFRLDDYNHTEFSKTPQGLYQKTLWINFTLSQKKINCFYKVPHGDSAIYYRRIIPRPTSGIVELEFAERDRIEKVKGVWKTKCG